MAKVKSELKLTMPPELKHKIAKLLIHKVVVFDHEIEVHFKTGEGLKLNFPHGRKLNDAAFARQAQKNPGEEKSSSSGAFYPIISRWREIKFRARDVS